ncbi:MAG: nickel-responsive transcriptional regulator NikR [Planctomycetes bacterium]|nr:nickel-responsive transcriptional regulator NikR [Planctomycetota bacterium]
MSETVRFGVSLSMQLLDNFDKLIRKKGYENRSEAIRDLIREELVEEEWATSETENFGILFLVYDHHEMSVDTRLLDAQHEHVGEVISSLHIHIDHHNCLEIIVLKGPGKEVRAFGEKLISMRGVKYGKLNLGTTGKLIH